MQEIILDGLMPNLNEVINMSKRHWGAYAGEKKKWGKKVIKACTDQNIKPAVTPITITMQCIYPINRRHDPDNTIIKMALDGLVEAGIIPDDSFEYIKQVIILSPIIQKETKKTILKIYDANETPQM